MSAPRFFATSIWWKVTHYWQHHLCSISLPLALCSSNNDLSEILLMQLVLVQLLDHGGVDVALPVPSLPSILTATIQTDLVKTGAMTPSSKDFQLERQQPGRSSSWSSLQNGVWKNIGQCNGRWFYRPGGVDREERRSTKRHRLRRSLRVKIKDTAAIYI